MARRGRPGVNPADENPYRSAPAVRSGGSNPADVSPYRSAMSPPTGSSRSRLTNPADQSPYRSAYSPAAASRGTYNSADESPYRSAASPGIPSGSGGSGQSVIRRRARPPPLETVTPISPVAPMTARKTAPGRETTPRKVLGTESTSSQEIKSPKARSPSRPLEMGPAEVRLHAENAQAIARLHAEHSQRIAQLLMGSIECRSTEIEGGTPEAIKPRQPLLCGGCCGSDRDRKLSGPSAAAMAARRQEIGRLNALHAQALAKQETQHQRQKALLQVDEQRKDSGNRPGIVSQTSSPKSPGSPKAAGMTLKANKPEPRRQGVFACCGRGGGEEG